MDDTEANTPLGNASRHLAAYLVNQFVDKDRRDREIDKLQAVLYDFGKEIAKKASMYNHTGF